VTRTSTESVQAAPAATQAGRRGLGVAVVGCVLSGGVALLAVGRVWLHYTVPRDGLANLRTTATGHAVAGAASTLALVVLAGVVVLPATRDLGRRVAGAVIALSGLGIGYLAVLTIARTTHELDVPGASTYTDGRATAWPWIALVAGVVAIAAGVFAMVASGGWPAMGRRYEQAGSAKRGPATETSIWDRLDDGDDPTA
jgi:uncharacterized membrane protein (TIGR02234 family)